MPLSGLVARRSKLRDDHATRGRFVSSVFALGTDPAIISPEDAAASCLLRERPRQLEYLNRAIAFLAAVRDELQRLMNEQERPFNAE